MNHEYKTRSDVNGKAVFITVCYEVDGYKPLIYGMFDDAERDMTNHVSQAEYDRIYDDICNFVQEG